MTSKVVHYKLYGDFQSLPISTYCWKDLYIDFVIGLLFLVDWKDDSDNTILVVIDRLIKMVYYKPIKTIIDVVDLAEVIINIIIKYHGLLESIISD